jgi:putative intracellular protease/amidase
MVSTMSEKTKALIVLTSHGELGASHKPTGYWLAELTHFYDVVNQAGFEIGIASPKGGEPPMEPRSRVMRDPINKKWMENPAFVQKISHTLVPAEVRVQAYGAIYFPGGHGPMYDLSQDARIADITRTLYESGGIVAAVCHGPAALVPVVLSSNRHLLEGKTITGFTNLEEALVRRRRHMPFLLEDKLRSLLARYTKGLPLLSHVEVDGRLITGQNPRSANKVAEAVVRALNAA